LTPQTVIVAEAGSAELWRTAGYLAEKLATATGFSLPVEERTQSEPPPGAILLTTWGGDESLGEEGYELEVRPAGIVVRAPRPGGVFRGVQTLRQLLPPAMESATPVPDPPDWTVPAATIADQPAFPWRGMLLDCCRHFMSVDFIKRYIDLLAYHKMNRFHWHLTEDQGWRIEIDKYPRLTEIGAWRNEGGVPYGGYYTKAEIREVVAYAAERYITVVPEIEMPGHSQAALAAYPEFSCTGGPFAVGTRWGVYEDVYCAGNDGTFAFLQDILDEVLELFPGPYIHLGADECPKSRWQECPKCQARIEREGLADEHELQSYFIRRMVEYLRGKGKQVIGWDEIMEGGLTEGVIVQYWRTRTGDSTVVEAARAGHQVIVSPTSHCYFDYPYSAIDLATVYSLQPVPDGLDSVQQALILGGEGNMWTERAPQEVVDQRLFPRILALAEVLWRNPERRDFPQFLQRVGAHYPRLIRLGVRGQVPTPLILPAEAVVPDRDAVEVRLACGLDEAEIRYSLDGSPLDDTATVYTGPFRLDRNAVVRAAAFHPDLAPSPVAEQRFQVGYLPPATPAALLGPGLTARYYEGSWPILPDFSKLEPVSTVRVTTVDLSPRQREDEYGLEFSGYLRVERAGIYTFILRSDDGSTLEVGGLTVVDNDGRHGMRERAGQVALAAGDYPFRLCYFEADGEQGLEVLVEGPGLARQPLPAGMLWSPPADR
jgi:hexosaminidase